MQPTTIWTDFNLLECFINYASFFFLASMCCDLFICEKVKDLFDMACILNMAGIFRWPLN